MARPVSTTLLKVVAEAASAYRTGSEVYVVASSKPPYDREVFYSYDGSRNPADDARQYLTDRNPEEWTLFGPFVSDTEAEASSITALDYRVTVEWQTPSGEVTTRVYGQDEQIDSLFLTLPAIDKFLIPYYTSLLGVEAAREIRQEWVEKPGPLGHVWNTKRI